jgi:spore coat protein U-like protein
MRSALFGACLVTAVSASVQAQSLTGTLEATLTLTTACAVTGSALTSGLSFGTLSFGSVPATFTGTVTAQATGGSGGAGLTQIVCSPDVTSVLVSVNGGDNAGQGSGLGTGARALKYSGSYMPYDVFSDAGRTQAYPLDTSVSISLTSPGTAIDLPIYGLINKTSTAAVAAGAYSDTLQVSITW